MLDSILRLEKYSTDNREGGKPFDVTMVKEEDVRVGNIKSSWMPQVEVPGLAPEQIEYFSKMVLTGCLLCGLHDSWAVSDEWNRLLPEYKFTDAEDFLLKSWTAVE